MRVAQVDSDGLPDSAEIGAQLALTAHVQLGGLAPADVLVQVVIGRVGVDDTLSDITTSPMRHTGTGGVGEVFEAEVALPLAGAVGYTVRVLPQHRLLATPAELGLVVLP